MKFVKVLMFVGVALMASGCATMEGFGGAVKDSFQTTKNAVFGGGHLIGAQINREDFAAISVGSSSRVDVEAMADTMPVSEKGGTVVYETILQRTFNNTFVTYTFEFDEDGILESKDKTERKATEGDLFRMMSKEK